MYRVKFTNAYKRAYKLMKKRGANMDLLDNVVDQLRRGETLAPRYRDHALSGATSSPTGCWCISLKTMC